MIDWQDSRLNVDTPKKRVARCLDLNELSADTSSDFRIQAIRVHKSLLEASLTVEQSQDRNIHQAKLYSNSRAGH